MRTARISSWISPEAYLASERTAAERHEYVDGLIRAMVGASKQHAALALNIAALLLGAARGRGCRVFSQAVKVRVEAANAYYYPDVVVSCDPTDADPYVVHRPQLVVEVLSPSTEHTDRSEKVPNYQTIASLQEILLVSQGAPRVERWCRDAEGWRMEVVTGADGVVTLPLVGAVLPLAAVYAV